MLIIYTINEYTICYLWHSKQREVNIRVVCLGYCRSERDVLWRVLFLWQREESLLDHRPLYLQRSLVTDGLFSGLGNTACLLRRNQRLEVYWSVYI